MLDHKTTWSGGEADDADRCTLMPVAKLGKAMPTVSPPVPPMFPM